MADSRPLENVVVAELGGRIAVGTCGSLLAQLGATVLYVEGDGPKTDKWLHRSTFALGKEPIAAARRREAVAASDIVLTSSDVDDDATDWLAETDAIHIDITAFGRTGPMAGLPWSDALVQALSGIADTNGQETGPPYVVGAPILAYQAAIYAAAAAVAALRVRRLGGPAQSADIALYDCGINSHATYLPAVLVGKTPKREGNRHPIVVPWNSFPTRDGDVLICTVSNDHFTRLCKLIGRPEIPESILDNNTRAANRDLIEQAIAAWTSKHSLADCVAALSGAGLAGGPITTIDDLPNEPNLVHRNSLIRAKDGDRTFLAKAALFATDGWTPPRPERLAAPGSGVVPPARPRRPSGNGGPARPLDGIRVIEFGQYTTAPLAARHLAALGAEVIKIEPPGGDPARNWDPRRDGLGYYFMFSNADKEAIAVDLRDKGDRSIVRDLIASADVIVQNMKPGSLDRLGFGWEDVRTFNPRIVCAAISGFGVDSVYEGRPAVDTIVQGSSGIMDLTRDEGLPLSTGISYSDIVGGEVAMLAVLAGLELRDRTGAGMSYDISMQDVTAWVTETTWNVSPAARGPDGAAVECKDGFVWMADPAAADGIETRTRTRADVVAELGGMLAPVLDVAEAARHPQTAARGLIVDGEWPTAPWPLLGSPIKLSRTPPRVRRPVGAPQAPTPELLTRLGIQRDSAAE